MNSVELPHEFNRGRLLIASKLLRKPAPNEEIVFTGPAPSELIDTADFTKMCGMPWLHTSGVPTIRIRNKKR